jgi:NitT/TauT family transport system substrate-binding protein
MTSNSGTTRRDLLTGGASLAVAGGAISIAKPTLAATRVVTFTLPWLAQGSSLFTYAGRAKGIFAKRGIDFQISRGFGSLAAGQAVGNGQFQFGMLLSTPLILIAAQGLPITSVATMDYESSMGVGVLANSGINKVPDLAGKKMGGVASSGEYPFFPAFAKLAGLDPSKVERISVDPKILERSVIEGQMDAMTGVGTANIPVFLAQKKDVRWFLYATAGLRTYGQTIATRQDILAKDPTLVADVVDGLIESLAFSLRNPDEAMSLFFKEVPEMALNPNAREFARLGMGLSHLCTYKPEPQEHGLGWSDPAIWTQMIDLVMQYSGATNLTRPTLDTIFTNRFAGKERLTAEEWSTIGARVADFGKLMS